MNASKHISPHSITPIKFFLFENNIYCLSPEMKLAYGFFASLHNKYGMVKVKASTVDKALGLCHASGIDGATLLNDFVRLGVLSKRSRKLSEGGYEKWYEMVAFSHETVPSELEGLLEGHIEQGPNKLFPSTLSPIKMEADMPDYSPSLFGGEAW